MKLRPIRPTAKIRRKKPPVKLDATAARRRSHAGEFDEQEEDSYEKSEPNMKLSQAFIVVLILHLIAVAGVFGFNSMKNRQHTMAKIAQESSAAETAALAGAASTAASAQDAATHTVAAGDTLTRIAAKYNTTIGALEKANELTADSILRVGQTLQLPAAGATAATSAVAGATPPPAPAATTKRTTAPATTPPTTTAPPPPASAASAPATTPAAPAAAGAAATTAPAVVDEEAGIYEVVAGDNPYAIARRLGVSYQALLELNNIDDPKKLQIGQKLKIPGR